MDRRLFVAGALSFAAPTAQAQPSGAIRATPFTIERFDPPGGARGPAVMLLHGADGQTNPGRYQSAARTVASAGFSVFAPHYLETTGDRRAAFSEIEGKFPVWLDATGAALDSVAAAPGVAANRLAVIGISLGGALALALSARDARVKAVVSYFGYLPDQLRAARRFAPTLILHGDADRIVPVENAYAIETLLQSRGALVERQVYAGQGHGFGGAAQADAAARTTAFLRKHTG